MKQLNFIIISLAIGVLLSSCGQSKSSQEPLAAGAASATGILAKCSIDLNRNSELGMKLQQLEDPNLSLRPDLIRIKMIRFPAQFSADEQNVLQFWSRTVTASGTWSAWGVKPRFYFEYQDQQGVTKRTTQSYESVSWANLKQVSAAVGVPAQSAQEFFSRFNLVVQLTQPSQRQTLTLALYQGSRISHEATALAPGFELNPQAFAANHSHLLSNWHPLQNHVNSTAEQLISAARDFCF